ncbi:alpha/beta hydrolase [Mycobacterium barrassiae]|uniref:alpha/beta hydrolase family protein n=1 Tax=Mycobacterium barrassiae TaxID=319709 RepID=UPI002265CB94|nr:alpha/beta hydrolase [Mycobacterium barrassiae]MCV7298182.1 alpha/beta hydrolase [Mycobacterium barrassiae]
MGDRFLVWMATGVVTAGISAGLLAGSGIAMATDGDSGDGGNTSTSSSSDSTGSKNDGSASATGTQNGGGTKQGNVGAGSQQDRDKKADEKQDDAKKDDDKKDDEKQDDAKKADAAGENTRDETTDDVVTEPEVTAGEGVTQDDTSAAETETGNDSHVEHDASGGSQTPTVETALTQAVDNRFAKTTEPDVEEKTAVVETEREDTQEFATEFATEFVAMGLDTSFVETQEPELAAVEVTPTARTQATAVATATPLNLLLDVIGTIVFGLYGFVIQLFGGPPMLPANSTVTVHSSRLRMDCGCAPGAGESVPADWYVPQNSQPDRLIYLQHGFLAAGPWYSHTAATMAEQTNSIVVAPSITSNFLDYGQCWLGGAPMHQAMAGVFADGNTALADSAAAAGYTGPIPDRVVLMGHSLGGGAVSGIAGYMTDNGSADRLAGVVLLDGVGLNGLMASDLRKVDDSIPIYQLAAPKYMWNMFGSGTAALLQARPDADFHGVTLAGGSHVDTMRGGNFLIQFSQQLVAGFSQPQNVAAAQILMVGWVNDMFAGNRATGIYLDSGETRTITTPGGAATLVDLPNSLRRPYLLNFLEPFMAMSAGLFTLQPGCLREEVGSSASCTNTVAA